MEEYPLLSWEELKFSMGQRFGSKEFKSPQEQLIGLKQKRSIEEYVEQFQELSTRIRDMDWKALLAAFLNGLSTKLQDDVRILTEPGNVHEALMLALKYQHKWKAQLRRGEFKRNQFGNTMDKN